MHTEVEQALSKKLKCARFISCSSDSVPPEFASALLLHFDELKSDSESEGESIIELFADLDHYRRYG